MFRGGQQVGSHLSATSKALISFLATRQGRSVGREEIVHSLWSIEYDKNTQHRLSTLLWRLRNLGNVKKRIPPLLLIEPTGDVRINGPDIVRTDVALFEDAVRRCRTEPTTADESDLAALTRSVGLYTADFLRDVELEWVAEKRQYLRQCYLDILQFLIEYYSHKHQHDDVIEYAEQFLRIDPYLESIHVLLIMACLATGRRSLAAARADTCRRVFNEELGVALADETRRLISLLASRADVRPSTMRLVSRTSSAFEHSALVELRDACSQVVRLCSNLLSDGNENVTIRESHSLKDRKAK